MCSITMYDCFSIVFVSRCNCKVLDDILGVEEEEGSSDERGEEVWEIGIRLKRFLDFGGLDVIYIRP